MGSSDSQCKHGAGTLRHRPTCTDGPFRAELAGISLASVLRTLDLLCLWGDYGSGGTLGRSGAELYLDETLVPSLSPAHMKRSFERRINSSNCATKAVNSVRKASTIVRVSGVGGTAAGAVVGACSGRGDANMRFTACLRWRRLAVRCRWRLLIRSRPPVCRSVPRLLRAGRLGFV